MTAQLKLLIHRYDDIPSSRQVDLRSLLSQQEESLLRNLDHHRASRFILERGLLRQTLGEFSGQAPHSLEFVRSEAGKPRLISPDNLYFNLSHCKEYFVLAISRDVEVGVDIENSARTNNFERLARYYFSQDEIDWLLTDVRQMDARFCQLWTVKESLGKLRGSGINKSFLKKVTHIEDGKIAVSNKYFSARPSLLRLQNRQHFICVALACKQTSKIEINSPEWHSL